MQDDVNYLCKLPYEMKLFLFSYINTYDFLQLCDLLPELENFSENKSLMSAINFYKEYRLVNCNYLQKISIRTISSDIITSLNINCIYWVKTNELLQCLKELHMLECLYALDTNLSITDFSNTLSKALPLIHTLAIPVISKSNDFLHLPINIKHLCLMESSIPPRYSPTKILFNKLENLETLCLIDISFHHLRKRLLIDYIPNNIRKLILIYQELTNTHIIHTVTNGTIIFKTSTREEQICIERVTASVTNIYHLPCLGNSDWDRLLNEFNITTPFGYKDAKKLVLKKCTIEDIEFEEINFTHDLFSCIRNVKATVSSLLLSKNFKLIKKLSINYCLCKGSGKRSGQTETLPSTNLGIASPGPSKGNTFLNKVINNSPFINTLEIWKCLCIIGGPWYAKIPNGSLGAIKHLKYLKNLTLSELPSDISYEFLIQICIHCQKLESLRIVASSEGTNLNDSLCLALPHAKSLKDFLFDEDYHTTLDGIIEALCALKYNLERVNLKCFKLEEFNETSFEMFLAGSSRLRFLYISVSEIPNTIIEQIMQNFKKYGTSVEKVYVINDKSIKHPCTIPMVHYAEMVGCHTTVGGLDRFNLI